MNSGIASSEETKTVWPFGKFGRAYDLNKIQYRSYRIAWGALRISLLIIFISNVPVSNYLHNNFGLSKYVFLLSTLFVGFVFFLAVFRITSTASIAQSAPRTPPPDTDPPPFHSIGITLGLIAGIGGAIWAVLCALVLVAAVARGDKIEPSILGLFLIFSIGSVFSIRQYRQRRKR